MDNLIDVDGVEWNYVGFKPAGDLTHSDLGKIINFRTTNPLEGGLKLASFEVYSKTILVKQYRKLLFNEEPHRTSYLSVDDTIYLWEKMLPPPMEMRKEYRFRNSMGDLLLKAEVVDTGAVRTIYESIPAAKVEVRDVGEWQEYEVG